MKKVIKCLAITVGAIGLLCLVCRPAVTAWMMSVPETAFDDTAIPAPPDYSNRDHWAALPDRKDGADWLPRGSDYEDRQATARGDVFFVHPTAAFYGDYWNAAMDNWLAVLVVDYGIVPQHASPFNSVGKIYAPRYRSVRMPIWWAEDKASVEKAVDLAYQDVKQAFHYYLQHWNKGRPIILASHSQGTLHLRRLLKEEFDGRPLGEQLVAAYIIGNTVPVDDFSDKLPICASAEQTGCYVTWNTVLEGGDSHHWVEEKGLGKLACVNPLSWKVDMERVDKSQNHGSIPMVGYEILFSSLGPLHKHVVGARCGPKGILWIEQAPEQRGYTLALFEGGSYHTYDINFYYDSIRNNAQLRMDRFLVQQGG